MQENKDRVITAGVASLENGEGLLKSTNPVEPVHARKESAKAAGLGQTKYDEGKVRQILESGKSSRVDRVLCVRFGNDMPAVPPELYAHPGFIHRVSEHVLEWRKAQGAIRPYEGGQAELKVICEIDEGDLNAFADEIGFSFFLKMVGVDDAGGKVNKWWGGLSGYIPVSWPKERPAAKDADELAAYLILGTVDDKDRNYQPAGLMTFEDLVEEGWKRMDGEGGKRALVKRDWRIFEIKRSKSETIGPVEEHYVAGLGYRVVRPEVYYRLMKGNKVVIEVIHLLDLIPHLD